MVPRVLTRDQAREIDRRAWQELGMPGLVLMENAGRSAAEKLVQLGLPDPVLICCGKGNNGGDGLVMARHLELLGRSVQVLLWADPAELRGDARVNCQIVERSGVPLTIFGRDAQRELLRSRLQASGCVVDALLGTGTIGDPRPPLDQVIDEMNAIRKTVFALDLPSGLDCDTGMPSRFTVRARHTGTFVAYKAGFLAPGAAQYTGKVHVLSIGVPRSLLA